MGAHIERSAAGPTRLQAGWKKSTCVWHPGEQIRTPRVLVKPWKETGGSLTIASAASCLFEYVPRNCRRPLALRWPCSASIATAGTIRIWATRSRPGARRQPQPGPRLRTHWLRGPLAVPEGAGFPRAGGVKGNWGTRTWAGFGRPQSGIGFQL